MNNSFKTVFLVLFLSGQSGFAVGKDQKEFLDLHNWTRIHGATCGGKAMPEVKALVWNQKLAKVARRHVKRMATEETVGHNVGGTPHERLKKAGYRWVFFSENVASGYSNPNDLLSAWLDSPNHCMNIMDNRVTEFAAAEHNGYWVTIFAAPKDD